MIRKYTPLLYGHNMSGIKWGLSHEMTGHFVWYFPKFYIGFNVHPNRLRQVVGR